MITLKAILLPLWAIVGISIIYLLGAKTPIKEIKDEPLKLIQARHRVRDAL